MKPPHTRLTCRAQNRFSPSLVLWQHFIGAHQPFLHHHHRLSSTAATSAQDGAEGDDTSGSVREGSRLAQSDSDTAQKQGTQPRQPRLSIKKVKAGKGTWYATKAEGSIAKNLKEQHNAKKTSLIGAEQLLASARTAFEEARDYVGVVVPPTPSPRLHTESRLPWCLPKEKISMPGIERLADEMEKFYQFSKPDYYETLARRHLIEQVRDHTRQTLPNHVLEVFGSERTGLALATSDVDLRLISKNQLEESAHACLPPPPEQRIEAFRTLRYLYWSGLSKHKGYILANLRYGRYPLISLQDRDSGLNIQIVLSNDTSRAREIMQVYMEQYPYLRPLYFVVKSMFDVRGLSDVFAGGFGSYPLFMMIVASIRHSPHPRNDAAGGLINFLRFYQSFDTTKWGISVEPTVLFDKKKDPVVTDTVRARLEEGTAKPLPPYMLSLRDPADKTNDLGRKAIAIKHVQATFRQLRNGLDRDMARNTRASILGPLVGPSYMLNMEHRHKLRSHGTKVSTQVKQSLAAIAKMVRDREMETDLANQRVEADQKSEEEKRQARNERLREEAERTAVLEHGDAIASILGMPSVEHKEAEKTQWPPFTKTPVEETSKAGKEVVR